MLGDIKQYEIVYLINGNDIYLQKNTKRCSVYFWRNQIYQTME